MTDKISIVIPLYNKEKYIIPCLQSISSQNYVNFEVIIVDDGSEDESVSVVTEYIARDSRMKLIKKLHEGVSSARNHGIQHATGKYILFVDVDDVLDDRMIQYMVQKLQDVEEKTIVVTNIFRIKKEMVISQDDGCDKCFDFRVMDKNDYIVNYLLGKHSYCVWNKLFDLELIKEKNIKFIDNKQYYPEDIMFNLEVLLYVERVIWVNEPLYYHISRMGSLSNSKREKITERYFNMCQYYRDKLRTTGRWENMGKSFSALVQNIAIADIICLIRNNECTMEGLYSELQIMSKYPFFEIAIRDSAYQKKNSVRAFMFWLLKKKYYRVFIALFEVIYRLRMTDRFLTKKKKIECLRKLERKARLFT